MDRAEKIGIYASGGLHAAVILWAIVGDMWFTRTPTEPVQMTQVSVISDADFQAMQAAAPSAGGTPDAVQQTAPEAMDAPSQDDAPPEVTPEPPQPTAPEPQPAAPEPEPAPEPQPDMSDLTEPPEPAEVVEVPPEMMPPVIEPQDTQTPEFSPRPVAKPARRVAPEPAPTPEPDTQVAAIAEPEARPEESVEPPPEPEETPEPTAPEEAGTEIETEASEDVAEAKTSAPPASPRPRTKPARPAPAPEPAPPAPDRDDPQEQTQTASDAPKPAAPTPAPPAPEVSSAVDDALAQALGGGGDASGGTGAAPSGPPITRGEKEALIVDVKRCWNVGALSSEALRTTVTLAVDMNQNATPIVSSIRMIDSSGGSQAAANQAFEAGRRAIVRCGSDGFPLPAEKYGQWQTIEIVFNPENMRMR